jgi:hypothetical protein
VRREVRISERARRVRISQRGGREEGKDFSEGGGEREGFEILTEIECSNPSLSPPHLLTLPQGRISNPYPPHLRPPAQIECSNPSLSPPHLLRNP